MNLKDYYNKYLDTHGGKEKKIIVSTTFKVDLENLWCKIKSIFRKDDNDKNNFDKFGYR
jgi:hypothetical protein